MRISRRIARRSSRMILACLVCLMLTNMTGCARYVAVNGDEMVMVKKGELEGMHSDNELLIQALTECRSKR